MRRSGAEHSGSLFVTSMQRAVSPSRAKGVVDGLRVAAGPTEVEYRDALI